MNRRARRARSARHPLRQPGRSRRDGQLLERPGPVPLASVAAAPGLPSRRWWTRRGRACHRLARTHRRQPQRPRRARAMDRGSQDRTHLPGRLRAGRRGHTQGRATRERRARRALPRPPATPTRWRCSTTASPLPAGRSAAHGRDLWREAKVAFFGDRKVAIEPRPRRSRSSCAEASASRTRIEAPAELDGPLAGGAAGRAGVGLVDGKLVRTSARDAGTPCRRPGLSVRSRTGSSGR